MQSFVVRVTIPESLEDLRNQVIYERGSGERFGKTDLELLATETTVDWSVPRHVMNGDVILFQVSANARRRARRLRRQLYAEGSPDFLSMKYGCDLAEKYAGSVVSIGRVDGEAYFATAGEHFASRHYATVVDLQQVWVDVIGHKPYSEWPEFAAHGPVAWRQFTSDARFREFVAAADGTGDPLPSWVTRETVTVYDNVRVSRDTWMSLARRSEFGFALESAVRYYYADWLLRDISDRRVLYSEVRAGTRGGDIGWVDNVILVKGVPIPTEVKVNASAEPKLFEQLNRYREADTLTTGERTLPDREHDVVLVVDQEGIYVTNGTMTSLPEPALRRRDTSKSEISRLRQHLEATVADRAS